MDGDNSIESCATLRHTWFWILAAHGRLDQRAAIESFKRHAWYCGITTEFCRCNKSFEFANSETETCKESCIIHFPTIPPCSTKVDVPEISDVPIFPFSQIKKTWVQLLNCGSKRRLNYMFNFCLYSLPAEHSAMGQIVLDLTNLAYQPTTRSREQPGHPEETRNLCHVRAKTSISSSCTRHTRR